VYLAKDLQCYRKKYLLLFRFTPDSFSEKQKKMRRSLSGLSYQTFNYMDLPERVNNPFMNFNF